MGTWILLYILNTVNFTQFYPIPGKPMDNPTEVELTLNNDTLKAFVICHSKYGILVKSLDKDRLELGEDFFGIIITQDRNSGFFFMVNPKGVKRDGVIINRSAHKAEWDFIWDAQITKEDDSLWKVEFSIPLDRLNLQFKDTLKIFVNFVRSAKTEGVGNFEAGTLVPISGSNFYDLSFTREFTFPNKRKSKTQKIFMTPYIALYREKSGTYLKEGVDLGLKNGGIDLTITGNPEYATVEADIDRFNLDKNLMVYYPEKRPFFMYGFELWSMPFQVFYSRTLTDIDAGLKINGKAGKVNFNSFIVEERDTSPNPIPYLTRDRITGGLRGIYSARFGEFGLFYLRSKDQYEAKGGDFVLFLPYLLRLNAQYTLDKNNKKDISIAINRRSRFGLYLEAGFEQSDSLDLNTCYLSYPLYTRSFWLYSGYGIVRNTQLFPRISVGFGGTHAQYLSGQLYERKGSLYATLGIRKNLEFTYNLIPWRRYDEYDDTTYDNLLHFFGLEYEPFANHYLELQTQFGDYFGGKLKYYSLEYTYTSGNMGIRVGYGFDEEPDYTQRRLYIKGKLNVTSSIRLRLFAQHSDISKTDVLNFLTEYEIKPGTSLLLALNYEDEHKGKPKTQLLLKFTSALTL